MDKKDEFIVQSYNTKELAGHYGVRPKILRKWIAPIKDYIGTRYGNYFTPQQVQIIKDHLGAPFIWIAMLWAKLMMDIDDDPDDHRPDDHHHRGNRYEGRWRN